MAAAGPDGGTQVIVETHVVMKTASVRASGKMGGVCLHRGCHAVHCLCASSVGAQRLIHTHMLTLIVHELWVSRNGHIFKYFFVTFLSPFSAPSFFLVFCKYFFRY